jgi:hypothetical protein
MGQPMGDGVTVFVVHGSGFLPGTQVKVALTGYSTSPVAETVDPRGTFNYAIDQGHAFFPGMIPVGDYQVVGGGAARAPGAPPPAAVGLP